MVHAVRPALIRQHQHLPRPVELHVLAVGPRVRVAQLVGAVAAHHHRVDGTDRVTVASEPVRLAEGVDRVRGERVEVAGDGRGEAELQQAALKQRDLRAARSLARVPADHLDRLVACSKGLLPVARPVLHHQPHRTRIPDLEAELVASAAPHGPPHLLARLLATDRVQREHLAAHVRPHDPAHHDLLRRRVVARLLGGEAALDRERGLSVCPLGRGRDRSGGRRGRLRVRHRRQSQHDKRDREEVTDAHMVLTMPWPSAVLAAQPCTRAASAGRARATRWRPRS